ncbi:histidinol-phosphatase HisJ family protein [Oscillibacter sp. MSJ-2]|uniref:Histidinol-phosphatase n=1 Tax=Dysosmobacter acutus TaxID=2841504 RepID=A0ABS6FDT7_9FIRM|nr:histidinol-phosphatase HisJ family protein [Dysosmobacter acutus]MBU5627489.1 histidinol-phosphatase HisJ family protein [Dysosmobacter acutus]
MESVFSCCVHTHSLLCDGRDTMERMAGAAWEQGVRSFGFSGHSHTPIPHDREGVLSADASAYRAEALRLRQVYKGRMEVLIGIEWDALSDVSFAQWDYWIGSVHNLKAGGRYHAVDWDREKLICGRDQAFGGDIYALIEEYYREVGRVAEKKPTILGHIDQICKLNGDGGLFDEEHHRYRAAALSALHQADPSSTLLEINTGAVARGYRKEPYPALWLLREWRRMGGRIIVTSDAHSARHLLYGYDMGTALAQAAGFSTACILDAGGIRETTIDTARSN